MFVRRWRWSGVMLAGVLVSSVAASAQMGGPAGGGERGGVGGGATRVEPGDHDAAPNPGDDRPGRMQRPEDPSVPQPQRENRPPVGAGRPGSMRDDSGGMNGGMDGGDGGSDSSAYTVRRGDTLGSISQQVLGDRKRWKEIARANGIDDPAKLSVGRRLTIPGRSGPGSMGGSDATEPGERDSMRRDGARDRGMNPGDAEGRTGDRPRIQDEDPNRGVTPSERESSDPTKRPAVDPGVEPPTPDGAVIMP